MAWIESHQELREHPKTKRLCRALTLSRREAVGLLHFLWWWSYDYAADGDLSVFTDEDIADAVDWENDPGELVAALTSCGFLTDDRQIHDWEDFAQKWIERRRADRERKAAARRKPEDIQETSDGSPPEIHSLSGVTGPNLTIPDLTNTGPDQEPQVPDELVIEVSGGAGGGADAPTTAAAKSQAEILRRLSEDARTVLDTHREAHGRRLLTKLTPESARVLEDAVADLGLDRLQESVRYMAGKIPPVPDLSKAINAARTKRQADSEPRGGNGHRNGSSRPPPNGRPDSRIPTDASAYFEGRNGPIPRR
jgi:hypothetical protein